MKSRRKSQGSVMVFVVLVVGAVTITAIAGLSLTGTISTTRSKLEKNQELKCVVDGVSQLATADLATGVLTVGNSKTYTLGGNSITVTAAANPALANTFNLTIVGSSGALPISTTSTVAFLPSVINNLWSYGIFSNSNFTWPLLGSNKVTGSAYFKNSISILATGQITKDFKTASSFNPLGLLNIGGAIMTGLSAMTFPTVSNTTYTNAATRTLSGNQTINGYTFPSTNALVVVSGTLAIKGAISGDGTIYATGNVTVNGNITRSGTTHHIVIITPGNITFNAGSTIAADGYFYAGGTITLTSNMSGTGALVANAWSGSGSFNETWDSWLTQASANGKSLYAPGFWP